MLNMERTGRWGKEGGKDGSIPPLAGANQVPLLPSGVRLERALARSSLFLSSPGGVAQFTSLKHRLMTSMQMICLLAASLLCWFQWRPAQSTASGIHHSAFAQNLSAGALPELANQGLSPQAFEDSKREFVIFDATLYKQKPDLTRYGFKSVSMVYKHMMWPIESDGATPPDRGLVRKAAQASESTGIAVLDVEHWPLAGDSAVVQESIRKYETLIEWFKEDAPSVKVGYYGVAPMQNYWDVIQPIDSPKYSAWQKSNDRVASIARLADVLFPSVYTFYEDQDGWSKYAARQIQEARRYAGGKPVYIFLWQQYHDSNRRLRGTYLPPGYWRRELETAQKYADGVVIWGGNKETWNEAAPWWLETQRFLLRSGSTGRRGTSGR